MPPRSKRWRKDDTRTTYVFDVREPAEYVAGHYPGAISAPGGQLVQATDLYAGVLGARIVVSDDKEARALMTASWLKQMGWQEVHVLPQAGDEKGRPAPALIGTPSPNAVEPSAAIAIDDVTVIDLSPSPHYRRGHIPGAWFAIRSRLAHAFKTIAPKGEVDPDLRGRRAGEPGRRRRASPHRPPGPLAERRQRRLASGRLPDRHRRAPGRRAGRRLAQALRAGRTTTRRP